MADIAKDQGKSVEGLVDALMEGVEKTFAEAVEAGRLTQAQADRMLLGLEERITARVNGEAKRGFGEHKRFGQGFEFSPGSGSFFAPRPSGSQA
jgi:hypothetical protein